MNRTLLCVVALALTLLPACGGSDSSAPQPDADTGVAAPVAPATPATPAAPAPPAAPAAPAIPDDVETPPGSCSISLRMVNGRAEYDERCASTSRECTLGADDPAWSCLCTAASGHFSSCQVQMPGSGVVAPPPNCCPAG